MRKTLFISAALAGVLAAFTLIGNSTPTPTVVRTAPADVVIPATGFQPDHVFATLPTTTTTPPKAAVVAPKPPAVVHRPVAVAAPRAAPRPVYRAPARVWHAAATIVGAGGKWACIIARESGGNPRALNRSSGAGGLFQFLPSSFIAYGGYGLPQNASVAEQWRVALNAYARSGWSPWSPYDGC